MPWNPSDEEKPVNLAEFLAMAEARYPGITRNPLLRHALSAPGMDLEAALAEVNPVRLRANARVQGLAKPLSDEQQIATFKAFTGVRTRRTRSNGKRKIPTRQRRNYGPGANKEQLDTLFSLLGQLYVSEDTPVIALRELVQNASDAINAPKTGSKALGQVTPDGGRIDVVFDREARTLTVSDNGCGMDPKIICKFTTLGGTTKGKPLTRMTPEEIEHSYPPFQLKIKGYTRKGSPGNPPDGGRYWIRINGLYQFDLPKGSSHMILPADYVLDFHSPGSAGGFGAAKAVIFMTSTAKPFRWELHTQDNFYTGQMADEDTESRFCEKQGYANVEKVERRQGTSLTIYDLDPALFDGVNAVHTDAGYIPASRERIEFRMRRVLAANNLKGITITFNGEEIPPLFSSRGGTVIPRESTGQEWYDGIFRRPLQAKTVSDEIYTALQGVSSNPQGKYPFTKGRDAFSGGAVRGFYSLQNVLEISPEALLQKKDPEPDITFDPGKRGGVKSRENAEIEAALGQGFSAPGMDEIMQEADSFNANYDAIMEDQQQAQRAVDAAREQQRLREARARAKANSYSEVDEVEAQLVTRDTQVTWASESKTLSQLLQETKVADPTERLIYDIIDAFRNLLDTLSTRRSEAGLTSFRSIAAQMGRRYEGSTFLSAARRLMNKESDYGDEVSEVLLMQKILLQSALEGGGGLADVSSIESMFKQVFALGEIHPNVLARAKQELNMTNPFGASVALHVSRTNFSKVKREVQRDWQGKPLKDEHGRRIYADLPVLDEKRYQKFVKQSAKYTPLLVLWDQMVRAVVNAAGVWEPKLFTGFVLDDTAYAMWVGTTSGSNLVLINPLTTMALIKSFKNAADFAAWLHARACHEIAHMADRSKHGDGHGEKFSILREAIATKSYLLMPLFTQWIADVTPLRDPFKGQEPVATAKARYRKIAEDVTCASCLKDVVIALESSGRLDTVRWVRERMDWEEVGSSSDDAEREDEQEDEQEDKEYSDD